MRVISIYNSKLGKDANILVDVHAENTEHFEAVGF